MKWNLNALYLSFSDSKFLKDIQKLDIESQKFTHWANHELLNSTNHSANIKTYIQFMENLTTLLTKLISFASLTSATDATHSEALDYLNRFTEKSSELTQPSVIFQMYLKNLENFDELIIQEPALEEYHFFLSQLRLRADYMLSEKEEVLISKMSMTGSTAWGNLQNKLTSTLQVSIELDGQLQSLPLPAIRNLAYHADANVRLAGYNAEMAVYKEIEESSAAALNGIKGEVNTLVDLRGYKSALEETLIKSRMDEATLKAMMDAIFEYLPVFRKYFIRKAQLLGHKDGLPFYDLFAPVGKVNLTYTYSQAMEFIIKQFGTFSDDLADFTQHAYQNEWLDVKPRPKKRGGAFCSNLHPIKESRILSNFSGSFSNMTTLAHELGHAYHGSMLVDESILNSRYPMPIAETASIFCETIVVNAALKQANQQEQLAILESSISDYAQVIVDIYSRFLFESALFSRRKETILAVSELKSMMLDAQRKAYGDGLAKDHGHPYMWINKPHYYSAGLSFYNFPYAFGLLFSKGLYAEYLIRGPKFVKDYQNLLKATGKKLIVDVAKLVDIDVSQKDFYMSSLALIAQDIDKFIKLSKEIYD